MKRMLCVLGLACTVLSTGCYVATIDMGKPASTNVHQQAFAPSWVFGLVPPPTVNAASLCPGGVSKVETQHSFLNYLVAGITFGIYTPIQITVTCAEGGSTSFLDSTDEMTIPAGSTDEVVSKHFMRAAQRAVATGEPVYVRFER
jgi:Bor protein